MIIHGRSKRKDALIREANTLGQPIEIAFTLNDHHTKNLAEESVGFDLVISCGGDGTNNHVVNGLMQIPTKERPALGFIPAGSGNDFARVFSSGTLSQMIEKLASASFRDIDLIQIDAFNAKTYVLNMTTCGIGAEIAKTVNARKFKMPAAFNYYTAIIAWLAKYKAPVLKIDIGEKNVTGETFLAALGNGAYAGNGLGLNPQSGINDGLMGLSVIGNVGVFDFIKYQSTLKRCDYVNDARVTYHKSKSIKITVLEGVLPIETDGEFLGHLTKGQSFSAQILPSALKCV